MSQARRCDDFTKLSQANLRPLINHELIMAHGNPEDDCIPVADAVTSCLLDAMKNASTAVLVETVNKNGDRSQRIEMVPDYRTRLEAVRIVNEFEKLLHEPLKEPLDGTYNG